MDIFGIDFTSAPTKKKAITCAHCWFEGEILMLKNEMQWTSFVEFEAFLRHDGEWIVGIDFPFGQPRRFIENIGWPNVWVDYTRYATNLGKQGFKDALSAYRSTRQKGDKQHLRETDRRSGGVSPMMLYGVPVGLMYFEGAQRLLESPASVLPMKHSDPDRIIVEAYPGVVVKNLMGNKDNYKDEKNKSQSDRFRDKRNAILRILSKPENPYGFSILADKALVDDTTGDRLDALLCAVQAAWAWQRKDDNFGIPESVDVLEGWIPGPIV